MHSVNSHRHFLLQCWLLILSEVHFHFTNDATWTEDCTSPKGKTFLSFRLKWMSRETARSFFEAAVLRTFDGFQGARNALDTDNAELFSVRMEYRLGTLRWFYMNPKNYKFNTSTSWKKDSLLALHHWNLSPVKIVVGLLFCLHWKEFFTVLASYSTDEAVFDYFP